jgi:hypothetical protein
LITPDSTAIANSPGEGVAILPLTPQAKPLDFLPKFDKVLSFSSDGVRAAMLKSNSDSTQSLFLVTNQGEEKELLKTNGELLNCQFDSTAKKLYCLMMQLVQGKDYSQQLSLMGIDLKTFKVEPLLVLSNPSEMEISVSPDGLSLLFDQVVTKRNTALTRGFNHRCWVCDHHESASYCCLWSTKHHNPRLALFPIKSYLYGVFTLTGYLDGEGLMFFY